MFGCSSPASSWLREEHLVSIFIASLILLYNPRQIFTCVFHEIIAYSGKMIPYEELFYVVFKCYQETQRNHNDDGKEKIQKQSGLMSKTKALNCPTNFVRFDWNGNEIITLISKIVVSLRVTAMTLMLSEIPIQRLTLYKATFISCTWCSTCC